MLMYAINFQLLYPKLFMFDHMNQL